METENTPTDSVQSEKLGRNWERKALEKIALAGIEEQKRGRRWRIFFAFVSFIFLGVILFALFNQGVRYAQHDVFGNKVGNPKAGHIALIRLNGTIAGGAEANAEQLSALLRQAAAGDDVRGILIEANSPGGSPVQSSLVYQTIRAIKSRYDKPILTVVTDTCASGCYYIASASDEIYADKSSIVGSIGVISQSYGYADAAKKLGIEPRTYTAGENKDFLNPARQPTEKELAYLKTLLDELHQNFIDAVKAGRGERLKDTPELFSGLFWTGTKAQALGLIDGIATPQMVAEKIGDYPVYDYSQKTPLKELLKEFKAQAQGTVSNSIKQALTPQSELQFK